MRNKATIEDMLLRWAQIATDECVIESRSKVANLCLDGAVYLSVPIYQADFSRIPEIEYHVRMCIRARGWEWKMESIGGQVTAYVSHEDEQQHDRAHSSVLALLTAYIAAIEALAP